MVLRLGRLALPLVETPLGPLLSTQPGPFEALAWIVNLAVTQAVRDLAPRLERGEEVLLGDALVRRAQAGDDLAAAGARWRELAQEELGDDACTLVIGFLDQPLVLPRATLAGVLGRLRELRAEARKPPAPWLFRPDPFWNEPAPGEDEPLRELEARAAEWDAQAARTPLLRIEDEASLRAAAALLVARRTLLGDLEAAGILADAFAPVKERRLRTWDLPLLADYTAASARLHSYLRSPERRAALDEPPPARLRDGRVSVDWFRCARGAAPEAEPYAWLAACERALREAALPEAPAGELYTRAAERWWRLAWRRDDDRQALLVSAEPA
jgi:hypothetical protein